MTRRVADLRVCASCEWVFKASVTGSFNCPKCEFVSYGARYVYGPGYYRYLKTQDPWFDRKMNAYYLKLQKQIEGNRKVTSVKGDLIDLG